ncbi:hypothetical protein CBL_05290 [Carabus blaptoides fortunei]
MAYLCNECRLKSMAYHKQHSLFADLRFFALVRDSSTSEYILPHILHHLDASGMHLEAISVVCTRTIIFFFAKTRFKFIQTDKHLDCDRAVCAVAMCSVPSKQSAVAL